MPHCAVKQPNGLYAIWSTIVDHFVMYDATPDEIVEHECNGRYGMGYLGGKEGLTRDIRQEFINIEETGVAWKWAHDWQHYVRWCVFFHGQNDETIQEMIKEGVITAEELCDAVEWSIPEWRTMRAS